MNIIIPMALPAINQGGVGGSIDIFIHSIFISILITQYLMVILLLCCEIIEFKKDFLLHLIPFYWVVWIIQTILYRLKNLK